MALSHESGRSALVSSALEFLQGTKTSEYMSPELRDALYVPRKLSDGTPLEPLIARALQQGQSVIVTGSAGGGKTMLLNSVREHLRADGVHTVLLGSPPSAATQATSDRVTVVPDLTAVGGDRAKVLTDAIKLGPLLIAANEGVLIHTELPGDLDDAKDTLRQLQLGKITHNASKAVVLDLAGLDPVVDALPDLLRSDLLHEAVDAFEDGCVDHQYCPRRLALKQLAAPRMANVVAEIIHNAVGPGELLYRDLWDFVSDALLGGTCQGEIPTSPWFWRLFYGDSLVARLVNDALTPEAMVLNRISPALYRGDWETVDDLLGVEPHFVVPGIAPNKFSDPETRVRLMRWLRAQASLMLRRKGEDSSNRYLGELATSLETRVTRQSSVSTLIQALNAYFQRKRPQDVGENSLELWIEMAVERRTDRAASLISLGQVPATRLKIIASQVIANVADVRQDGSRYYLTGSDLGESERPLLVLDFKLFKALAHGRAVATSDRSGDDADFAIRHFFIQVSSAMELEAQNRLSMLSWDRTATVASYDWRLDHDSMTIEMVR